MHREKVEEVYNGPYFRINKVLQIATGLWPYRPNREKYICRMIPLIIFSMCQLPLVYGIIVWCGTDLCLCGENVSGSIYIAVVGLKYTVNFLCESKMVKLYEKVAENWTTLTDPDERTILLHYSKKGKIMTISYIVYLILAAAAYCQLPLAPIILDLINPLNESRQRMLIVKGEYYVNPYDYYYQLYTWYVFVTIISISIVISIDTTFTVIVHQILGVFAIVKHRLHKAVKYNQQNKDTYKIIIEAIRLHKGALQFIELIESSYRMFFLVVISLIGIYISLCAIIVMGSKGEIFELIRWIMLEIGTLIHLLYLSYPGQQIIDHSSDIFIQVYMTDWYCASKNVTTLLKIMMIRGLKPSVLTAGGLYVLDYKTYGMIIKTAMSYITFLASFQ